MLLLVLMNMSCTRDSSRLFSVRDKRRMNIFHNINNTFQWKLAFYTQMVLFYLAEGSWVCYWIKRMHSASIAKTWSFLLSYHSSFCMLPVILSDHSLVLASVPLISFWITDPVLITLILSTSHIISLLPKSPSRYVHWIIAI